MISEISENKEKNLDNSATKFWNKESKYIGYDYILLKESFFNCRALLSISNIPKINTSNIIDMSYMFYNFESLKSLPDISDWVPEMLLI